MNSLRRTLGRRLLVALSFALVICGVAVDLVVRERLTAQFDAGLEAKARFLASLVKEEAGEPVEVDVDDAPMPEFYRGPAPEYYQVWLDPTHVIARSPSLGVGDLPAPERFADLDLPDGRRGRAVTFHVSEVRFQRKRGRPDRTEQAPSAIVVVARERASLDRAQDAVTFALGLSGLVLLGGIPILVARTVRRSLRPLDRLGDEVARIDATSLVRRFESADLPAELVPVVGRLNALLDRLEQSFERERRFSADVAHELRTPLAELRATAEVALRFPEARTTGPSPLEDVLGATEQMQRLVEALFTLARCESGRQAVSLESVSLAPALADAWAPFAARAAEKALHVEGACPADLAANTDPVLLGSVLTNLFSNAVEYTPEGGAIVWQVGRLGDHIELSVANTNTDLADEDRTRAFEPFWRKDAARSGGVHSGLGLSLVSAFTRLIGGECQLQRRDPQHVEVRLRLPAAM
jgi:signal transduction histidine kinase